MYGWVGRLEAEGALVAGLASLYTCVLCLAAFAADLKSQTHFCRYSTNVVMTVSFMPTHNTDK